jgi:hypothetical protein
VDTLLKSQKPNLRVICKRYILRHILLRKASLLLNLGFFEIKANALTRSKLLEKTKKSLETRLTKLLGAKKRNDVVTFEQLGVDRLYVD